MKRDDEDAELIALNELRRRFEVEYEITANDDGNEAKVINNHHNRSLKAQQSDIHRLKTQNWWPVSGNLYC